MSIFSFGSLPNLISLLRLVLVPVVISMIVTDRWVGAFLIFVAAGVSDAVDGWLANRFNLRTELGAYLDPLADKMLLISIYVALAVSETVPATIAIKATRNSGISAGRLPPSGISMRRDRTEIASTVGTSSATRNSLMMVATSPLSCDTE